jgi:hypothetical protein
MNSLRKLDVEKQPFMERDIDSRAGYKHNLTPRYLKYLQAQVMQICEREGLHQVNLLAPARTKITNAEYEARESGQIAMDARNEKIRAAQPQSLLLKKLKRLLPGSPAKKPLSPTSSSRTTLKTASPTQLS